MATSAPADAIDARPEPVEDRLARVPAFDEATERPKAVKFFENAKPAIEGKKTVATDALKMVVRMLGENRVDEESGDPKRHTDAIIEQKTDLAKKAVEDFNKEVDDFVAKLRTTYPAIRIQQLQLILKIVGADRLEKVILGELPLPEDIENLFRDYAAASKAPLSGLMDRAGLFSVPYVGEPIEAVQEALVSALLNEAATVRSAALDHTRTALNREYAAAETKNRQATAWEGFEGKINNLLRAFRDKNGVVDLDMEFAFFDALIGVAQNITGQRELGPRGSEGLRNAITGQRLDFPTRSKVLLNESELDLDVAEKLGDSQRAKNLRSRLEDDVVLHQTRMEFALVDFLAKKASRILNEFDPEVVDSVLEEFKKIARDLIALQNRNKLEALDVKDIEKGVGLRVRLAQMLSSISMPSWRPSMPSLPKRQAKERAPKAARKPLPRIVRVGGGLVLLGAVLTTPWTLGDRELGQDWQSVKDGVVGHIPESAPAEPEVNVQPTQWKGLNPAAYPSNEVPNAQWLTDLSAATGLDLSTGAIAVECVGGVNVSDGTHPAETNNFPQGSESLTGQGTINWEIPGGCKVLGFEAFSAGLCVDDLCRSQRDGFFAVALTPEAQ